MSQRPLLRILLVLTVALISWGGVVHNTQSSLACPDWPLCFGQVFPKMEGGVAIEHSHRLLAATVGLLTIWLAVVLHRRRAQDGLASRLGWTALGLVVLQGVLGGITVLLRLPTLVSTGHLAVSLLYFASLLGIAYRTEAIGKLRPAREGLERAAAEIAVARVWCAWALGAAYVQMLLGALVRHTGSGAAAGLGPSAALLALDLQSGGHTLWPPDAPARLHVTHRLAAVLVVALVLIAAARVRRAATVARRSGDGDALTAQRRLALLAALLVVAQAALGIASVWTYLSIPLVTLHLTGATLLLAALLLLCLSLPAGAVAARQPADGQPLVERAPRSAAHVLSDIVALTKPRLLMLVVFTTGAGLLLAPGQVSTLRSATAIFLTALIVAAGTTLNEHMERDVDALMERTRTRPLPAGRLHPDVALVMGVLLACLAVPMMVVLVNPLTGVLGSMAFALYVGAYTPMKRRSAASVYVGAIPGATPIVMGWTAATGSLDAGAGALFAILFLWQLPHFWAISLYRTREYAAAGFRVMPLAVGERATRWLTAAASVLLVAASLLPVVLGLASTAYLIVASALALAALIAAGSGMRANAGPVWARRTFLGSLLYLPLLLGTLVLGAL